MNKRQLSFGSRLLIFYGLGLYAFLIQLFMCEVCDTPQDLPYAQMLIFICVVGVLHQAYISLFLRLKYVMGNLGEVVGAFAILALGFLILTKSLPKTGVSSWLAVCMIMDNYIWLVSHD